MPLKSPPFPHPLFQYVEKEKIVQEKEISPIANYSSDYRNKKRRSLIETGSPSREDVMLVAQPNTFYVTVIGEINFAKVKEISNTQRLLTRDMKDVSKVLT